MSGPLKNDRLDTAKAEQLIADIPMIPEVESIAVEPYTDHTGDPAFQLKFRLRKGVEVDSSFLQRFIDFSGTVQTRILHSDLDRFPYARLEPAA
jgi:hypothetical protein